MKYNCLVFTRDHDVFEEKLKKLSFPNLNIVIGRTEEIINAHIEKADIFFMSDPVSNVKYIKKAKNLKWIQSPFAGVDAFMDKNIPQNYLLTNVKDSYGKAMAEYIFAYILGFKKNIFQNKKWQKEKYWNQFEYSSIENSTIGIIGTGSIGKDIAKIAKSFDMNVKGLNTSGKSEKYFDKTYNLESKKEFFKGLDYTISVLPNTPQTYHFFNEDIFSIMDKKTIFMNIGRGKNVCEKDLVKALENKEISCAVLDVFENEPLEKKSCLWDTENLFITPHISGYINTDMIFKIFAENYKLFIEGKKLQHLLDFKKGY